MSYHIEDDKIYDSHTLVIDPLDYEVDEVKDMVSNVLERLKKDFKIKTKCKLSSKLVQFEDGEEDYMVYLRVSNKAAYNILAGFNKDGSERIAEIEDPDFIPPEESYDDVLEKKIQQANSTDWWVLGEIEDEVIKNYSPKIIRKVLPPLIELDDTEDEDEKIMIERAYIDNEANKFKHNVIWANIPKWVTYDILRDLFSDFATYPFKKCGRNKEFPLISIKNNKYGHSAYIAFDDRSYDAEFSMFINEYVNVKNPETGTFEKIQFKYFGQ